MRSLFIRVYETVLFFLVLVIFIGGLGASLFLGDYIPAFFAVLSLIFYIERYQKIKKEALDIIKRQEEEKIVQETAEAEQEQRLITFERAEYERALAEKEKQEKEAEFEEKRKAEALKAEKERKRVEKEKQKHIQKIIDKNIAVLEDKYRQKVYIDDYGAIKTKAFEKDLNYFINNMFEFEKWVKTSNSFIRLTLSTQEKANIKANILKRLSKIKPQKSNKNPFEFEEQCALILCKNGWEAEATRKSGDQGVDVVASKDGKRVVLQCKLYSHPVGNKAVQEVFSGKVFYGADFAAVVSNNEYTQQARELAENCGVLLLSVSDLSNLEHKLI